MVAGERRRFGYRRLYILLRREGFAVNRKRVYRLYTQEGLTVRRRKRRRRVPRGMPRLPAPTRINARWSLDFVLDVLDDGRRFRILTVVDDFTRSCLAIDVDTSIGGGRVAQVLQRLIETRGTPTRLVTDNVLTARACFGRQTQHPFGDSTSRRAFVSSRACAVAAGFRGKRDPANHSEHKVRAETAAFPVLNTA